MDSIYYESSYETESNKPGRFLLFLIVLIVLVVIIWKTVYADQQPNIAETTIENAPQEFMTESGSLDNPPEFLAEVSPPNNPTGPIISLRAATGKTITFKTQNGNTINETPPQFKEIPHLVLFRNSVLADVNERTLIVTLDNLEVPPAGLTVSLKLETQHSDPDLGDEANNRIMAWNESRRIENDGETTRTGLNATSGNAQGLAPAIG